MDRYLKIGDPQNHRFQFSQILDDMGYPPTTSDTAGHGDAQVPSCNWLQGSPNNALPQCAVTTNSLLLKMVISFVDLPMKKMVDLSIVRFKVFSYVHRCEHLGS